MDLGRFERSRPIERIPRIIKLLREIWAEAPDLRLCQLIGNCFPPGDNYFREDLELEERLLEMKSLLEFTKSSNCDGFMGEYFARTIAENNTFDRVTRSCPSCGGLPSERPQTGCPFNAHWGATSIFEEE